MIRYERPVVLLNDEMAEGVYMASGDAYTETWDKVERPDLGKDQYCFQVNAKHHPKEHDHNSHQTVTIRFNTPVTDVRPGNGCGNVATGGCYVSFDRNEACGPDGRFEINNLCVKSVNGTPVEIIDVKVEDKCR